MNDPLSGTKATADFISDLMTARADESGIEKAEGKLPSVESLHPDAQKVYQSCVAGFSDAGITGGTPEKTCLFSAVDFDRRHPNGLETGSESDDSEPDVEKTVSTAGMTADLGSPSAEVHLTDADSRKRRLGFNS